VGNLVAVDHLIKALKAEGINPDTDKFKRALRRASNPGGCADCGANTRIAIPVDPEDPEGPHKTACCGKKAF